MIAGQLSFLDPAESELLLDYAAFAQANGLSGPRAPSVQPKAPGLDRPAQALSPGRCRCDRWPLLLLDGGSARCLKCGRRP
ncbi:MAG: hypothetical protein M3Z06_14525 [Actinomycetota bacterium]|nr:hypothetical protein [Actinomycetota bacterium]